MDRIILFIRDEKNASLVADRLAKNYQLVSVDADQTFDFSFDLGIVDEPALHQIWEQVQARKQAARPVFLPFLLITVRRNVDFVTRHLWQTVDEIIYAPINPLELQTRVESLLRGHRLSLLTQKLTNTDSLTGIHNRRHFFELGERELHRAQRFHRSLSVIMAEVDHLQRLYDSYGYGVGHQVIRQLAISMQKNLRTIDALGRYAEDKFVILLSDTDLEGAKKTAIRLRQEVLKSPLQTEVGPLSCTLSMGISSATGDLPTLETLLERADNALCAAMQAGRDCTMAEKSNYLEGFSKV